MEKEAVKAFFEDTRKAGLRVWKLRERMEEVQGAAYSVRGVSFHERVQGGHQYDVADEVERIEAAQRAYLTAFCDFCDRECKAHDLLQLDPNYLRRAVMIERFINRKSWKQVEKEAGLSCGYGLRLVRDCCAEIGASREAAGILSDARGGEL